MEKDALLGLKPMLLKFGGGVDLKHADCKLYVFDGLNGRKVLARKVAAGPRVSREGRDCKSIWSSESGF